MEPQLDDQQSTEAKDLVVFESFREEKCAECGTGLSRGDFVHLVGRRPLCLACADLDHLVYLPRGDNALTRRARKHSKLSALVLRFSKARKRNERQGVLVEESALEQARTECSADAVQMFPHCPQEEERAIAAHASVRGGGRVGRSALGRALEEGALKAAVVAAIRHTYTDYDRLHGWNAARGCASRSSQPPRSRA